MGQSLFSLSLYLFLITAQEATCYWHNQSEDEKTEVLKVKVICPSKWWGS